MGLFDKILKMGVDAVKKEVNNAINDKVGTTVKNELGVDINSKYSIPSMYNEFPKFNGKIDNLSEKHETKYDRCTIDFYGINENDLNNYLNEIKTLGYNKSTNVRYDKGNTYIIVEYSGGHLKLVFHIKK